MSCKIIFVEDRLPKKIMSDDGISFVSEKFKDLSRKLNIKQEVSLPYHHQSNRQVEACITFVK